MCDIKGNRVTIKPLEVKDVYEMIHWGKHKDPLFKDYNFPVLNDEEVLRWYNYRTQKKDSKCFSVFDEKNEMIGYINLRNIRRIFRTAKLGIVFNPSVLNKGYGTEAIKLLLDYYFNRMKMKVMYLDVAKFNKRAIRCYEKNGFKIIREYKAKHGNFKNELFDADSYLFYEDYFLIKNNVVYCTYFEMRVKKEYIN